MYTNLRQKREPVVKIIINDVPIYKSPLSISPKELIEHERDIAEFARKHYSKLSTLFAPKEVNGRASFVGTAVAYLEKALDNTITHLGKISPTRILEDTNKFKFYEDIIDLRLVNSPQHFRNIFNRLDANSNIIIGAYGIDPESVYHSIAILVWKNIDKQEYNIGFYDPLGHDGDKKNTDDLYFRYSLFELEQDSVNINLQYLSKLCPQFNYKYRCPQYYADTEYCHFYTMQFLWHVAYLTEISDDYNLDASELSRQAIINTTHALDVGEITQIGRNNSRPMVVYNTVTIFTLSLLFSMFTEFIIKENKDIGSTLKHNIVDYRCAIKFIYDKIHDNVSDSVELFQNYIVTKQNCK